MYAFYVLILQPLAKRRIACVSKNACERKSLQEKSFLYQISDIASITFCYCYASTIFHDPVDTAPKMLENVPYQNQSACVLSLQSFFLLCIFLRESFCWKTGFWFLTGCICL